MNYKEIEIKQGTPEWHEFRRSGIGASDIAKIMAGDEDEILTTKISGKEKSYSDFTKKLFQDGHEWEEIVRAKMNNEGALNFVPKVVQSTTEPRFFASLDGQSDATGLLLEIKSTKVNDYLVTVQSGSCPDIWYNQIQWQMYVADQKECLLAVVNSENGQVYTLLVKRDEDRINKLVNVAYIFLERMDSGQLPEKIIENETMSMLSHYKKMLVSLENEKEELENHIKKLSDSILTEFNATKISGFDIEVSRITRQGSVNYKKIPELKDVDLNKYRNKDIHFTKVVLKSEKALTLEIKQEGND